MTIISLLDFQQLHYSVIKELLNSYKYILLCQTLVSQMIKLSKLMNAFESYFQAFDILFSILFTFIYTLQMPHLLNIKFHTYQEMFLFYNIFIGQMLYASSLYTILVGKENFIIYFISGQVCFLYSLIFLFHTSFSTIKL